MDSTDQETWNRSEPPRACKVLLVDDDRDFLTFLEQCFREYCPGYRVHAVEAGAKVMDVAKSFRPDIILLDVVLPDVDGYEVCRQLKADRETATIPVILLSGVLMGSEHRVRGLEAGAEGYICKPFHPAELIAQIRALLHLREEMEQRQREQDEARLQRMEALGMLAAGIAHDFNNMLTAVLGNLSFVRTCNPSPEQAREALREAEEAALRAREITQQLLTFARGGQPSRTPTALDPLLQRLIDKVLRSYGVPTHLRVNPPLPAVLVDPGELMRAIESVLINAREAVGGRGEVSITVSTLAVESEPPPRTHLQKGSYVVLEVRDTGPGIAPEDLERVFDLFFSTKGLGRGLGLPVAQSILRQHDGAITVESRSGEGTCVRMYIPATSQVGESEGAGPSPWCDRTRRKRILVMDDEAAIRRLVARGLSLCGYEVDSAPDGETAIALCEQRARENHPYDLVILDLTVPRGMSGPEAVHRIRRLAPAVRAVVSSGYPEDPVVARFRDYGFDAVARKPYSLPDLQRLVERLLSDTNEGPSAPSHRETS